ncbi:hypothetical protein [Enterococcus faecium]
MGNIYENSELLEEQR